MDFFCGLDSTGEALARPTNLLDQRFVYAFIPGERNLENLNYGVYIKNPLTNGDGTIRSEDPDSLAGVFNDEDGSFYCGEGYTSGSEPVGAPQVKDTAPDGKVIIKEPWTSETHSFIVGGYGPIGNITYGLYESDKVHRILEGKNAVLLLSNIFEKRISLDDGIELDGAFSIVSKSEKLQLGYLNFYDFSATEIFYCYIYEGILSEVELRAELEKIKSGNYYIPNYGVVEPVPKCSRRRDEYGDYKEGVFIENQNTDIQLVETNKRVTTKDYLGVVRVDNIDSNGVITGGGGIADIAGNMRATAATGATPTNPVKVVIEKL